MVAVTGVSLCGFIVRVYLLVLVLYCCLLVCTHTPVINEALGKCLIDSVVITVKHKMSIHLFCSENINEAVSILGKGVGVTFVSRVLGFLGKRFHFNEIR